MQGEYRVSGLFRPLGYFVAFTRRYPIQSRRNRFVSGAIPRPILQGTDSEAE